MEPKVKQNDFKLLNKMSRINHNAKAVKNRINEAKIDLPNTAGRFANSNDETSTSYAVNRTNESMQSSVYRAKEFAIKSRNIDRAIKTRRNARLVSKEGATKAPFYLFKAKRKVKADVRRKALSDKVNRTSLISLIKPFSGSKKRVATNGANKYLVYLGSLAVVVLLSFSVLFAAIFGGDNSSYFGTFIMPFDNPESVSVTSEFGYRVHPVYGGIRYHSGMDFGTPHHCNIYAVAIGEVVFADVNGGYGNCVIIKHDLFGDTMYTLYAHLSEIKVKEAQMVIQGEIIGIEGGEKTDLNHGTSTGHHLHFEVQNKHRVPQNPRDYLIMVR